MNEDKKDGASIVDFFDCFNRDADKQVVLEDVNRQLCEVLTELAEDIVEAMAETAAAAAAPAAAEGSMNGHAKEKPEEGSPAEGGEETAAEGGKEEEEGGEGSGVDEVAALAAFNDALAAIMREKNVTSKDMCGLPDEHPLKELFFSAFDQQMFHELLERFIGQVKSRKEGPGEWDAEAAEGECDEDHTLE